MAPRPRPAPARRMASRSGPRRPRAPRRISAGPRRPSRCRTRFSTPGARPGRAARRPAQAWEKRLAAADAKKRAELERRLAGKPLASLHQAFDELKRKFASDKPVIATRKSSEATLEADRSACAGARGRLGGSHAFEQHQGEAAREHHAAGFFRPLHALRHPRARHGRGDERHVAAWRHHPGRRHLPGLLRLLPPRHPHRRALEALQAIYVFTHDSIGLGEDGPTHQPDRASRGVARHAQSSGAAPGRCHRDGGVLADRARPQGRPGAARAHTPEPQAGARRGGQGESLRPGRLRDRAG